MMLLSQRSDKWNFRYPEGKPFEQRFAKINLVPDNQDTSLSGMAMGLLLQIYDAGGYKYFQPEVKFCGISVKGQGTDDPHTDTWDKDNPIEGYKSYYINEKKRFATWKRRQIPNWYIQGLNDGNDGRSMA